MARTAPAKAPIESFKIARVHPYLLRALVLLMAVCLALIAGAVALLPVLGESFVLLLPASLIGTLAAFAVYLYLPGRLHIGADGVLVDRRDEKRYVPFADLAAAPHCVVQEKDKLPIAGVSLDLYSGGSVKVPVWFIERAPTKRSEEISARICSALEVYRRRAQGLDVSMLERGERSMEAWMKRLRGLGEGANAGPREAPLPVDRLWRVVEDPGASASARAGAAVALSASLDEAGKERLRISAEATVSPELRFALESVASGDEEATASALAEV